MRLLPCMFLAALLGGCASVKHSIVTNDEIDDGVRYFNSAPYLLVYADGKGGIVWKIYHIADQTRLMSAKPSNFLAKVSSSMSFQNGVLTESTADTDTTALPKTIIAAAEKLLAIAGADDPAVAFAKPRFYRIVVHSDEIKFLESAGDPETP